MPYMASLKSMKKEDNTICPICKKQKGSIEHSCKDCSEKEESVLKKSLWGGLLIGFILAIPLNWMFPDDLNFIEKVVCCSLMSVIGLKILYYK